jgi:hypothetical protein
MKRPLVSARTGLASHPEPSPKVVISGVGVSIERCSDISETGGVTASAQRIRLSRLAIWCTCDHAVGSQVLEHAPRRHRRHAEHDGGFLRRRRIDAQQVLDSVRRCAGIESNATFETSAHAAASSRPITRSPSSGEASTSRTAPAPPRQGRARSPASGRCRARPATAPTSRNRRARRACVCRRRRACLRRLAARGRRRTRDGVAQLVTHACGSAAVLKRAANLGTAAWDPNPVEREP